MLTPEQVSISEEMVSVFAGHYNVFSTISTLPGGMPFNMMFLLLSGVLIGVPSLMALRMPIETPLGMPLMMDLADPVRLVLAWSVLAVIGLGLGSLYHRYMVGSIDPGSRLESFLKTWLKILLLAVLGYFALMAFFSVLILIAGEAGLIYAGFPIAFLAGVYLAFTPHGIVQYRLGVWSAVRESASLVRRNFFTSIAFLFIAFFVMWLTTTQIWLLPDEASWLMVLAILGHAFVSATLLASSYVFYQDRREWMIARQAEQRRIELSTEMPGLEEEPSSEEHERGV
jgi:uncharacterized membrane protein YqjE